MKHNKEVNFNSLEQILTLQILDQECKIRNLTDVYLETRLDAPDKMTITLSIFKKINNSAFYFLMKHMCRNYLFQPH